MPVKWKIYLGCACYLLLWAIFVLCYILYPILKKGFVSDVEGIVFAFFYLIGIAFKSFSSIRMVTLYKKSLLPSSKEKGLFIAGFCFNIVFIISFSYFSISILIPQDFMSSDDRTVTGLSAIYDFAIFVATIIAIYLSITDIMLLKSVERRHRNILLNFEIEKS